MVSFTFPVALGQEEKASFWNLLFSYPVEYLRVEIRQKGCSHSLVSHLGIICHLFQVTSLSYVIIHLG